MTIFTNTYNYQCTDKGLYAKETDKASGIVTLKLVGRPIYIKEIIRLLDTEEVFWNVRFLFNGGWHEEIIARKNITEHQLTLLLKKGADVGGWKTKMLVDYFYEAERSAKLVYHHKFLGWHSYNNESIYTHRQLSNSLNSRNSVYVGDFNLYKRGTMRNWKQTIQNHVVGHTELELALCIGF